MPFYGILVSFAFPSVIQNITLALEMAFSRVLPHFRRSFILSSPMASLAFSHQPNRSTITVAALLHTQEPTSKKIPTKWKPTCLYYTQGKCTKMDDALHVEKFNHNVCGLGDFEVNEKDLNQIRAQEMDYFLVLDLEGKIEILEFPVLLFDVKAMDVVNFFHRFVRPSKMHEDRINQYIEGKYGKLGVDRVWHDTAIQFEEVIQQFEAWLDTHQLWGKESGGRLNKAAFVTCGNWDLKTKIPQQCNVSGMKLPPYFLEWINLKDIFLNFYKRRAPGMLSMMRELQIPLVGSHHLGIDDTKNIARVLRHMLSDGAHLQITATRSPASPDRVDFRFKNRIQ